MYKKILVLVDEREASQAAIVQGVELAKVHRADVVFLYLLPAQVPDAVETKPDIVSTQKLLKVEANSLASAHLLQAGDSAEMAGVRSAKAICPEPGDAETIMALADRRNCDLIVIGVERRGLAPKILAGSILPDLISSADIPVLVCRGHDGQGGPQIVAGRLGRLATSVRGSRWYDDVLEDND